MLTLTIIFDSKSDRNLRVMMQVSGADTATSLETKMGLLAQLLIKDGIAAVADKTFIGSGANELEATQSLEIQKALDPDNFKNGIDV